MLWLLARSSGLVAMGLLTLTVLLGIAAGARTVTSAWPRFVTQGLHRATSATGVLLLVAHVTSVVVDPHAAIDLLDVVVPFRTGYRSIWTGLGTLAIDLLLVVTVSSVFRSRLRPRLWRAIHLSAYAAWGLSAAHGIGSGTDARDAWVAATTAASIGLVVASVALRLRRDHGRRGIRYRATVEVSR